VILPLSKSAPLDAVGRDPPLLASSHRREHQPERRHGRVTEHGRAGVKSPSLWRALASPVPCAYAPSIWVPPIHPRQRERRHRAVNLTASSRRVAPPRRRAPTPGQRSSFSSPWRVFYPVGPCRGMARVAAVDPHHRRVRPNRRPFGVFRRTPGEPLQNPGEVLGVHAWPHVFVATGNPGGSRAAGHPRPSHTSARTRIRCAVRVGATQACQVGRSRL
jgi:hypothetical protein